MDLQFLFETRALMREKRGYQVFFYEKHPELKEGEVYLCMANEMLFNDIELASKRRGTTAYCFDGKEKADKTFFPVFAQKAELDMLGIRYEIGLTRPAKAPL